MSGVQKHPVAPTLRRAFLKALDIRSNRTGKTLPEIMDELIEEEGLLAVMDRVAKFQERVNASTITHKGQVSLVGLLQQLEGAGHVAAVEEPADEVRH